MRIFTIISLLFPLFAAGCASSDFERLLSGSSADRPLNASQISAGLKEALILGAETSADLASRADGFHRNERIKIQLPPDALGVERTLRQMGLASQMDNALLSINRAAEQAAAEAKPIFVRAIRQLTFEDALQILHGEPDAATQYLRRMTGEQLTNLFQPKIENALSQTGATRYYGELARAFNAVPLTGRTIDPDLTSYVTREAIRGLFTLVAEEEMKIRANPMSRTTELMRRVFAAQDAQS